MKRYYAELCVWIIADGQLDAEDIAKQAAERAEGLNGSGVTSVSVNDIEECGDEDEEED
jgi:hypothetical protein